MSKTLKNMLQKYLCVVLGCMMADEEPAVEPKSDVRHVIVAIVWACDAAQNQCAKNTIVVNTGARHALSARRTVVEAFADGRGKPARPIVTQSAVVRLTESAPYVRRQLLAHLNVLLRISPFQGGGFFFKAFLELLDCLFNRHELFAPVIDEA